MDPTNRLQMQSVEPTLIPRSTMTSQIDARMEDAQAVLPPAGHVVQDAPRSSSSSRKRHSFFGRVGPYTSQEQNATQQSTIASHYQGPERRTDLDRTAKPTQPAKKRSEPFENFRNSLFGGRRRTGKHDLERRHLFASNAVSEPDAETPGSAANNATRSARFRTQQEYYHHLRKSSVSHPFNFQHITHTAREHLPRLQSVDERELTAEFWAVSTRQQPQNKLTGIKADDLTGRYQGMVATQTLDSSRPSSPSTMPQSKVQTRATELVEPGPSTALSSRAPLSTEKEQRTLPSRTGSQSAAEHPRRHSSMNALNHQWPVPPKTRTPARHSSQFEACGQGRGRSPALVSSSGRDRALESMPEEDPSRLSKNLSGSSMRAAQPLPPLPATAPKPSQFSGGEPHRQTASSFGWGRDVPSSMARRECSPHSRLAVSSLTPSPDLRSPCDSFLGNWEDDVDFCYQQQAESTCDFDWRKGTPASLDNGGGDIVSELPPLSLITGSPNMSCEPALVVTPENEIGLGSGLSHTFHKRGSSVGHRGFQAARNASTDALIRSESIPELDVAAELDAMQLSTRDLSLEKETFKPPFAPGYQRLLGSENAGSEYTSDVDSAPSRSSKHRKSSSYGSYESGSRSANSGSATENTRWSNISSTSASEARRSRTTGQKSRLGQQSPEAHAQERQTLQPPAQPAVPQSPPLSDNEHEGLIMRRPQTPGDRAAMQNAGNAVKRGRPATPNRFSRILASRSGGWV